MAPNSNLSRRRRVSGAPRDAIRPVPAPEVPSSIGQKTYVRDRTPFRQLTHGVYVVGVARGSEYNAFTAAWVMQASFDPLLLALSINPRHASYPLLITSGAFTVNYVMPVKTGIQEDLYAPH